MSQINQRTLKKKTNQKIHFGGKNGLYKLKKWACKQKARGQWSG